MLPDVAVTMTSHGHYQYAIELFAPDGRRLGQVPVAPDWEPALESVAFEGIRRGRLPAVTGKPSGTVEPLWHTELGAPYVRAFRAMIPRDDGGAVSSEIPTAYVRALARTASATFMESGALRAGDVFTYIVSAFPAAASAPKAGSSGGFTVEEIIEPLPLGEAPLGPFLVSAAAQGPHGDDDMPVLIPQSVLDEAVDLSRRAGDVETGGILIGRLHRDPALAEVFVEITALIPAPHTVSYAAKVTFTAETWSAVDAAIALRGRAENKIGWFHYHPDWCRKCPPEKRARCTLSGAFLSADDVHLHRVCFGRAYQVALLVSDHASTGLMPSLFGWRRGMVEARGFHVTDGVQAPSPGRGSESGQSESGSVEGAMTCRR